MLRNLNKSSGGRRILGTPNVGLLASQIISETATGDNGAGLLYDEALANTAKQLRLNITSTPPSGSLFVYENGSFELTGVADGSYAISYQYFVDNVLGGSDTATVTVGAANASASAGTGTSTGSGTGGAATGQVAGYGAADGGVGTSTGIGLGGLATAGNSASAPGGVGTSIGIGSGGRARGSNGLAPTVFVKSSGIYEQVSGVYVKQSGLYQPSSVFVKQTNSWIQL